MKRALTCFMLPIVFLALSCLWACGSGEDSARIEPAKKKAPVAVKLAANFPKDVPIYKPSILTDCEVEAVTGNAVAALVTKDGSSQVGKFYKDEIVKQGWTIEGKMNFGGVLLLQGKKDNISLNVVVEKGDDGTTVTLARGDEV